MLTETFQSIAAAFRSVLRNWPSMLLVALVYAALLGTIYSFLAVREASVVQVALTFALAISAPILFFLLQAMITSSEPERGLGSFILRSLNNLWKILLISLPLIALAVLIIYLLAKAQNRIGSSLTESAAGIPRRLTTMAATRQPPRPVDWRAALVAAIRYLTLGLFLPLAAIHLWLATSRAGLGQAIKRSGRLLASAFSARAVFIYVAGFLVFAVIPYFLLLRTIPSKHAWLELILFVARLTIIFALTLFGWVITIKALAAASPETGANTPATDTV